jgi:hypothetical protein
MTTPPVAPSDEQFVAMHAAAALRRKRDTLAALTRSDIATSQERQHEALTDATHAMLSLYLAASAAQRICRATDEPGPLGLARLDNLRRVTGYTRDAVMHWEDKGRRDPETRLEATTWGVRVNAPDQKGGTAAVESGIGWKTFDNHATRLLRWSKFRMQGALSPE